jgi:hypothetical protein
MTQSSGLGARITPISTPATANWRLARYSCAVIADHPSTGRCHAKRGCASEQKCTLHTGCIERCPSKIAPRWAPLSCWRGRPVARRVAVTGESILAYVLAAPRCSSAISRSLPAACLPARSPIPMLSTTAGTSSGRWRLRDRLCSRLNEGDHLVSDLSPLLRT